ncbi:glycosyltransferase family 2 protein [Arcicella sp. LKC2W]|uniref:glycosyltransferase family 2 protein n=1 Tax=Arcicella sp. LKC2W TaxID=2984198 RepID=UPI002B206228|nr:glycosyltransferase family 2 protein [Arcicella sp. LKC2W]MEA5459403.1 glycosyltransferase family 2 protein [Arcicella sp. LKC2W]
MKISVTFITLNSEKTLKPVLEAVSWADEIILVDSGSTDKTLEIAQQFKAKIVYRVFDGYGSQKNFATEQASHDWILSLDDDEILTPELQKEIQDLDLKNTDYQGFKTPRSLIFLGKLLRFSGEYRRLTLRLFNRKYGNWNAEYVHESVEVKGKIGTLKNQILHDSYRDLTDFFNKFNKYTSLGAKTLAERGKTASSLKIISRFPTTFLKIYLLKGSCLDGYAGFMWALLTAINPVVKYAKLKEMSERK